MNVEKVFLEGPLVITPDVFKDGRGYFFESFSEKKYAEAGINLKFVQDNISYSQYGTVRGLHYQAGENPQGKLCQVLQGEVLDVAVDIRFGSPTFGKYHLEILSSENKKQFWIPPGFAHGFSVLSENALFMYKCTGFYSKKDERAIVYNDGDLSINWQVTEPLVSDKDKVAGAFRDIARDFVY